MRINKKLEKLSTFNSTNWINWILLIHKNEETDPEFEFGDITLEYKLLLVKNKLEEYSIPTDNFTQAIISLLNEYCIKPNHEDLIYSLIQFLAAFRPEKHATFLELLFTNEVLKEKYYKEINLHYLLLSTLIYFKNIDDLNGYFEDALNTNDLPTTIVGLKYYLLCKPLNDYFSYLNRILKILNNNKVNYQFIPNIVLSIIEMIHLKKSYSQLYDWWINNEEDFFDLPIRVQKLFLKEFASWLNKDNPLIQDNHLSKLRLLIVSQLIDKNTIFDYFDAILPKINDLSKELQIRILMPFSQFLDKTGIDPYVGIFESKKDDINESLIFFKKNSHEINNLVQKAYKLVLPSRLTSDERKTCTNELKNKIVDRL